MCGFFFKFTWLMMPVEFGSGEVMVDLVDCVGFIGVNVCKLLCESYTFTYTLWAGMIDVRKLLCIFELCIGLQI